MWLVLVQCLVLAAAAAATPLNDYVNKPDPTYSYVELSGAVRQDGYTSYFINMTSQTWLSRELVSQSVWWHYMVVHVPDKLLHTDTAFLYITGGSNHNSLPDITSEDCLFSSIVAFTTGTVTATLFQIPNEPIVFSEDVLKKSRSEDAIIAFTWYHFFQHPDQPEYVLRLPMTKAAVRAMDTMADFAAKKNSAAKLSKFVVAGASKRGWATWTTGIVDERVIGIVPIVMDELNLVKNLHHHYRSLGGWTFAFEDYIALNFTADIDSPQMQQLAAIVDPYSYLDRLNSLPKYLINTGGDEFFLPDDNHYFWDDLKGDKYVRVLPNAEHSCAGHVITLMFGVRTFYLSLLMNVTRPVMTWKLANTVDGGTITLSTDTKPSSVQVYHATTLSATRRDFRLLTGPDPKKPTVQPVLWFPETLEPQQNGDYVAKISVPDRGWRAFFIQVTFPGPRSDTVYEFTTQANIVPDTFPFPDCTGSGCLGKLV